MLSARRTLSAYTHKRLVKTPKVRKNQVGNLGVAVVGKAKRRQITMQAPSLKRKREPETGAPAPEELVCGVPASLVDKMCKCLGVTTSKEDIRKWVRAIRPVVQDGLAAKTADDVQATPHDGTFQYT